MRHAKRRDAVERLIIDALETVGASVQQLDLDGGPDLIVGYRGENFLVECKSVAGKPGIGKKRTASGLKPNQEAWMQALGEALCRHAAVVECLRVLVRSFQREMGAGYTTPEQRIALREAKRLVKAGG